MCWTNEISLRQYNAVTSNLNATIIQHTLCGLLSKRKAMNRNWCNQKANDNETEEGSGKVDLKCDFYQPMSLDFLEYSHSPKEIKIIMAHCG